MRHTAYGIRHITVYAAAITYVFNQNSARLLFLRCYCVYKFCLYFFIFFFCHVQFDLCGLSLPIPTPPCLPPSLSHLRLNKKAARAAQCKGCCCDLVVVVVAASRVYYADLFVFLLQFMMNQCTSISVCVCVRLESMGK